MYLIEKCVCRTDTIEQSRGRPTKYRFGFNDRNGGCQLKNAVFYTKVIPVCRVGIDVVIESNDHLLLHERVGTTFVPFFGGNKQASVMMGLEYREEKPCLRFGTVIGLTH